MRESTTYQAVLKEGRDEGLIEGRVIERNDYSCAWAGFASRLRTRRP